MFKIPEKYEKPVSILIYIISLVISFGILFIPFDAQQLAAYGYGSIFIITLLGALSIFIPGPTMVAAFVIGSVLNPFLVSIVAGLGSAIGETTGYTVGYASRAWITTQEEKNTWYWRIFRWMTSRPFITIFVLAAIPNFLTDLSGLIAGRIKYPYPWFLVATFLGKTIRFGISAYLGAKFGIYFLRR
jgi:membrane protein YqaA with SNARE-associated domain